jgi:hypothetical protein
VGCHDGHVSDPGPVTRHDVASAEPGKVRPVRSPSPGAGRGRRWLVTATALWGVVLAGGVIWSTRNGEPTAREQTTVAQAQPTADRAAAELATAVLAEGQAVVAISGFDRLGDCRVTVIRTGARYRREVQAFVPAGTEQALLDRVAARLPDSYRATVRHGVVPRLAADVGLFVQLRGDVSGSGLVRFAVDTGDCRPEGDVATRGDLAALGDPSSVGRASAEAVLTTLDVRAAHWTTHGLSCANGAPLWTVEAVSEPVSPQRALDTALTNAVDGTTVLASPEAYAYRSGSVGVAVRTVGSRIVVTATTRCD